MLLRPSGTDRIVQLPPAFSLVTLREAGDAHAHACKLAGELGAGALVWTKRFDVAEFAVVLEPDEPLATARSAFFVGMNAMADALAGQAPPERQITFGWPDGLQIDGVLVGGGRLGWPDCDEHQAPDWLVFSGVVRTAVLRAGEPGLRPLLGGLDELGFEGIDAGELVASFARHLMAGFHELGEDGPEPGIRAYCARLETRAPASRGTGEAESERSSEPGEGSDRELGSSNPHPVAGATRPLPFRERKALLAALPEALATPTWRDPKTGMPWL